MYKAAIFDLDGTLVDSIYDIAHCMNHIFAKFGYPTYSVDEYKYLVGSGIRTIAEKQLVGESAENINKIVDAYEPYYIEHCTDHTVIYDGINEMLETLSKNGVKMAVLSNKPHNQAVAVVEKLFGKGMFESIWGRKEDFPMKPDPASVNEILKEIGVSREECVYVGDMEGDILVARNAGMDGIGVMWGIRGENSFVDVIPDIKANTVKELTDLILKNA